VGQVTVQQPAAGSVVTSAHDTRNTVQDATVRELKDNVARLSRQNDELNKEVGRLHLLEEQCRGASTQPPAAVAQPPAPAKVSPAGQSPPSRPPPKCYYCGGIGHIVRNCEKKISTSETTESAEMTIGITMT